jgi:23S rRNA (uracil1939-C5)-methyltransferase
MHADVVEALRNIAAEKLIYVSCNAATQARDMQLLDSVYEIISIQPVDMFPHTQHVENIVYARRRKRK